MHAHAMQLIIVPGVGANPVQPCLEAVCNLGFVYIYQHNDDADLA